MTSMLESSARIVDGTEQAPIGLKVTMDAAPLEEVAAGIGVIESFSNVIVFNTDDGLTLFDVSHAIAAKSSVASLRVWSQERVHTAVYTHGHTDHVGGADTFNADATERGHQAINYVAHEAVVDRFDRYKLTNGYNGYINMRQFRLPGPMFPSDFVYPDTTFRSETSLDIGGRTFELHHARGETDDHTWAWVPDSKAVCVGDLFIWQFPNAGNPQKVQRFAWEWAVELRAMAAKQPELMLPAHGMAIGGKDRVGQVLTDTAAALESLHEQTLALMNSGARLDDVIHQVRLPEELANKPYLKPTYDEPEFVVRNLWRLYGGWHDGNPANLKPATEVALATEVATLAGGADVLAVRAEELANVGDFRLACHLIEMAATADADSKRIHEIRAAIYDQRRKIETSFMASGIYRSAAIDSKIRIGELS